MRISIKTLACSLLFISIFNGCGGSKEETPDTPTELNSVAAKKVILLNDSRCPNGGVEIFTGVDKNGDGVLQVAERQNSEIVCNGIDGTDGADGTNGADGNTTLITQTPLSVGSSLCSNGGIEIHTGLDSNRNNILDSSEITGNYPICNGTDGTDGTDGVDGHTALIANNPISIGDSNCPNGGVEILFGLDMDRDNILDANETTSTRYICNGVNGVNAQTSPIIHTLHASPSVLYAGNTFNLGAVVTDPDNGALQYIWKDYNGIEIATTKMTTTTAPSVKGSYIYSFTAIDDDNNTITGFTTIDVIEGNSSTTITNTTDVTVGSDANNSVSITIPTNVTVETVAGDIDGTLLVSGSNQELAGTIFMKPAFNGEQTAQDMLSSTVNTLSTRLQSSGVHFGNISTRNHSSNPAFSSGVTAYYDINLTAPKKPVELINDIVTLIGSNVQGGTITTSLTALASSVSTENYRMGITIQYTDQSHVLVRLAFSSNNDYTQFEGTISDIIDSGSASVTGMIIETDVETFTANPANSVNYADFLFVVDNSGSMSSYQSAVRAAARSFGNALSGSNLNYNLGIITTDNSSLVGGDFIDNNITEFESRIIVGTNGSGTETGIYEAEQALASTTLGDSADGSVTTAGYPRAGSTLSVIILSDERSQYTSRANGTFDPANNLFIDRGYTVYSIISLNADGQYIDLTDSTHGTYTSISDTTTFDEMMTGIAQSAGALSNGYHLTDDRFINAASINVTVNGSIVTKDETNGWSYHSGTNTILFHGTAVPNEGDNISVAYSYRRFASVTGILLSIDANSTFYIDSSIDINVLAMLEDNSSAIKPLSDFNVTSSNSNVVAINNGLPVGAGAGQADILVEQNGVSSTISITVNDYPLLTLNGITQGIPVLANKSQLYTIDLNSSGTLDVTSISSVDTYAYLLDENLSTLTSNDDSGANSNFRITSSLTTGRYYLRVKGYSDRAIPTYDLNTTFQ